MKNTIRLIHRFGITPGYRGYRQLIAALELVMEDEDWMWNMMKLYTEIGKRTHSNALAVERNIRTLCGRAWIVNPKLLEQTMGYPINGKPTNSEFLSMLLSYEQRHGGGMICSQTSL